MTSFNKPMTSAVAEA